MDQVPQSKTCFHIPSAEITGLGYHTQLLRVFSMREEFWLKQGVAAKKLHNKLLLVVRYDRKDIHICSISALSVRILTVSHSLYHEKGDKGHLPLADEPLCQGSLL